MLLAKSSLFDGPIADTELVAIVAVSQAPQSEETAALGFVLRPGSEQRLLIGRVFDPCGFARAFRQDSESSE